MKNLIKTDWKELLKEEFEKKYFIELELFLEDEYKKYKVYPPRENIFNALNLTPFKNVKVVIFGQDPYHGVNQANGLCFSVPKNQKLPPSLKNIYKELEDDLNIKKENGDLSSWAKEGVLLLNTVLTVRESSANSHKNKGWEKLIISIIDKLNNKENIVYILWGKNAISLEKYITNGHIIKSVHPSPLSSYRGFFGSKPFSKTNDFLKKCGISEIDWS